MNSSCEGGINISSSSEDDIYYLCRGWLKFHRQMHASTGAVPCWSSWAWIPCLRKYVFLNVATPNWKNIFVGPQIRKLVKYHHSDISLNKDELKVWVVLKNICAISLGQWFPTLSALAIPYPKAWDPRDPLPSAALFTFYFLLRRETNNSINL